MYLYVYICLYIHIRWVVGPLYLTKNNELVCIYLYIHNSFSIFLALPCTSKFNPPFQNQSVLFEVRETGASCRFNIGQFAEKTRFPVLLARFESQSTN